MNIRAAILDLLVRWFRLAEGPPEESARLESPWDRSLRGRLDVE
jgi:hypothetical protein